MIFPSAVLFCSSTDCSDVCLRNDGLWLGGLEPGGNGEGKDDAEVLAGALRRPRGSLRVVLDMRRMEPGEACVSLRPAQTKTNCPY